MNPTINNLSQDKNIMTFTLSGVDKSIANALRRIILSDIPCVVFRTFPAKDNRVKININTSKLNNDIINQRLSCIPIFIRDISIPLDRYIVEVNKINNSKVIECVTTEDFKIKDTETDKYLSESEVRQIFPPDDITKEFIDIVKLRPKLSDEIPGEQLSFTAGFDIGTSSENSSFNVVCTAAYSNTVDPEKSNTAWKSVETKLRDSGLSADEIDYKKQDWFTLDAKRYFKHNSFDFIIETIGQYENMDIVYKATQIMIQKITKFISNIKSDTEMITKSSVTLDNAFDILIKGEGYTLANALKEVIFTSHMISAGSSSDKSMNFCGSIKKHPHIDEILIRVGFVKPLDIPTLTSILETDARKLIAIFNSIAGDFKVES